GDVANFTAEGQGLGVFRFTEGEKMIIFLERGAAARGIGDDRVEMFEREGQQVFAREVAGGVAYSSVGGESATAKLSCGDDDFAAVRGENADGGFIEVCEGDLGDAACEEGHAGTARAGGGKCATEMAREKGIVDVRA